MKILAEIDTKTHTVLEQSVLQEIFQELSQIKQQLKRSSVEKVSVNLREAAKMLGCTYDYVKQLYHEGKLRGRQESKGSVIFIDYQSVIDFIRVDQPKALGLQLPENRQEITQPLSDTAMIDLQYKLMSRK